MCGLSGDGRPIPLSWAELAAYSQMAGVTLPNEAWKVVRRMSEEYVGGLRDTGPLSISPMEREEMSSADGG